MSNKKKMGICPFCHENKKLTKDHIPPKNLFPKPRPNTLLKIPGCKECNEGTSKDDEYFRLMLSMRSEVGLNSLVSKNREKIVNSLFREQARGFLHRLFDNLNYSPTYTKQGIYVGEKPTYKIDDLRINKTAVKVIKGLFYHEFKIPVPKDWSVTAIFDMTIQRDVNKQFLNTIKDIMDFTMYADEKTIVKDGFSYRFKKFDEDKNNESSWILRFYNKILFIGFVTKD